MNEEQNREERRKLDLDLRGNLYLPNTRRSSCDYDDFILHVFTIEGVVEPLADVDEAQSWPSEGQHHQARRWDHPVHEGVQQVHLFPPHSNPKIDQPLQLRQPVERN